MEEYDYVKGYKAPISSLPKEIREIVRDKMLKNEYLKLKEDINDFMLEVDLYVSVDIKNYYLRSE